MPHPHSTLPQYSHCRLRPALFRFIFTSFILVNTCIGFHLIKTSKVVRRQIPITSALHRTVQSSQGYTFRKGILADLGNLNSDPMNYWLNIYVMLSRAVALENLLILRCPPKTFFDTGPPKYLRDFLEDIEAVEAKTMAAARAAATTMGF